MLLTAQNGEFTEIFINRNEDGAMLKRIAQNGCIAWVGLPRTRPFYGVVIGEKMLGKPIPNTGIKQNIHWIQPL
jgi:hypothetical protein